MSSEKDSYKQIFKATSVFGGVQVFMIIVNLLKSKVIAYLLGPEGVGISSLLLNPVNLISQITGLGINTSAIRDVAKSTNDPSELRKTVQTVRAWSRVTGLIGSIILFAFAPWISQWTFGSNDYVLDFRILSIVVLLIALGNENDVILKGQRRIKYIAKAGVFSAFIGLIVSIPIYYFLGKEGIVVVIVVTYLSIFIFNRYYAGKEKVKYLKLSNKELFSRGKNMASLGSMMVLGMAIQTLTMYFTNIFIRSHGDIHDVGLFQAGMSITAVSIDMVYNAMAGDFYPRLSAVCDDSEKVRNLINQQAEMAVILTTPIILIMLNFVSLFIQFLLSFDFLSISTFISWVFLAVMLRPVSYTLYYLLLAKGNTKWCFVFSVIVSGTLIIFYPLGYIFGGVSGLGVGYLLMMLMYAIGIVWYVKKQYCIEYTMPFYKFLFVSILIVSITFVVSLCVNSYWKYIINFPLLISTIIFCTWKLNERTDIISFVRSKIKIR